MPRLAASALIESVLAVRQPLSAPICEKPTVSGAAWLATARIRARTGAKTTAGVTFIGENDAGPMSGG